MEYKTAGARQIGWDIDHRSHTQKTQIIQQIKLDMGSMSSLLFWHEFEGICKESSGNRMGDLQSWIKGRQGGKAVCVCSDQMADLTSELIRQKLGE